MEHEQLVNEVCASWIVL